MGVKARYHRHAARRAFERHDLQWSGCDLNRLAKLIRADDGVVERKRQTNDRSLVVIDVDGIRLRAIYSRCRRAVVTILPPEEAPA